MADKTLGFGVAHATNDIGLISLPDGRRIAITVFVTDSTADEATREQVIARTPGLPMMRVCKARVPWLARGIDRTQPGATALVLPGAFDGKSDLAIEEQCSVTLVSRALEFFVPAFFRDSNRRQILRMDDTNCPRFPEVRFAPGDGRANGLRRIAFSVRSGG